MQKYVDQLVSDLEEFAKNPPKPSYYEIPPHMEQVPDLAELAQVPYKTLEELTGIQMEAFPAMYQLSVEQCIQLNKAIFKVYESLYLELVDKPDDIPDEWLYDVLSTNWDIYVQYLPRTGMDVELCSGDPMTCPYGDNCICSEEWKEEIELPERFECQVAKLVESISLGKTCHIHFDSGDIYDKIPDPDNRNILPFDPANPNEDISGDDYPVEPVFITIYPFDLEDTFDMMYGFIENCENEPVKEKLLDALLSFDPENKFNTEIVGSGFLKQWKNFEEKWIENHIRNTINDEINNIIGKMPWEMDGLFDDDRTPVNPESTPVPDLCVICKKHQSDVIEENHLCNQIRSDQHDSNKFSCTEFDKID